MYCGLLICSNLLIYSDLVFVYALLICPVAATRMKFDKKGSISPNASSPSPSATHPSSPDRCLP